MVEAVGRSAAGSTGEGRRQDVVALGGKDGAAAGIGRGVLGAEIGPGLEGLDGIDDAAAELAIGGAGSVGAVLLKREAGYAEKAGSCGGWKKGRREAGGGGRNEGAAVGEVRRGENTRE